MGCDICRAEAQISISESDKCLIPSSTFQHFSGLSEYALTCTHLHRIFTHLNSRISTPQLWSYSVMDMNTTRARTRGDFLMDREDLSECMCSVYQGRSVWKSHNFETVCVTEWVSRIINLWVIERKKHTMHIQLYSHTTKKKRKIIDKTILGAFSLKPCESSENSLCVHYTFSCQITGNPRQFITYLLQLKSATRHFTFMQNSILFLKVSNAILPGNYCSLHGTKINIY